MENLKLTHSGLYDLISEDLKVKEYWSSKIGQAHLRHYILDEVEINKNIEQHETNLQ